MPSGCIYPSSPRDLSVMGLRFQCRHLNHCVVSCPETVVCTSGVSSVHFSQWKWISTKFSHCFSLSFHFTCNSAITTRCHFNYVQLLIIGLDSPNVPRSFWSCRFFSLSVSVPQWSWCCVSVHFCCNYFPSDKSPNKLVEPKTIAKMEIMVSFHHGRM